jgi:nucleotide-binding universal stress UspA family protein
MTYASLMVSVPLGRSNEALLRVTARLAERFQSGVIGVAACRPIQAVCSDYAVPAKLFEEDRKQIAIQLKAAEAEFRSALQAHARHLEWRPRTTMSALSVHLAREARSADLVLAGIDNSPSPLDPTRHVDARDLVMQIGRPVLFVPTAAAVATFDRVLVGWKDTRESQRAIADALPFLARATQVTVAGIAAQEELAEVRTQLAEVTGWLEHHGVAAPRSLAATARGTHANELGALAEELGADLIVAGAYGHSRQRDWVLGGVTSDLLLRADRCSLMSH